MRIEILEIMNLGHGHSTPLRFPAILDFKVSDGMGSISKISANIPKSKQLQTLKRLWSWASLVRDIQPIQAKPKLTYQNSCHFFRSQGHRQCSLASDLFVAEGSPPASSTFWIPGFQSCFLRVLGNQNGASGMLGRPSTHCATHPAPFGWIELFPGTWDDQYTPMCDAGLHTQCVCLSSSPPLSVTGSERSGPSHAHFVSPLLVFAWKNSEWSCFSPWNRTNSLSSVWG